MGKACLQLAGAARRLLALGLVTWLAGLGCLLGCEGPAAASSFAAPDASESQAASPTPAASRHARAHARHSARRAEGATQSCAAMSAGHGGCCKRAKARAAEPSATESAAAESAAVASTIDGVADDAADPADDAAANPDDPGATSAHPHDAGGMGHCPLRRQTSDPARKVRASDAPVAAKVLAQSHDFEPRSFDPPGAARPRAHDRGGTYLRCCVFLI